jgi:hypothetical protein
MTTLNMVGSKMKLRSDESKIGQPRTEDGKISFSRQCFSFDAVKFGENSIELLYKRAQSKPLWLVWVGQFQPDLTRFGNNICAFRGDHWYRLLKQRLHWTLPQLNTPQQCERWSDLMPMLTWELWQKRDLVAQHHLPWQKPLSNLTQDGSLSRYHYFCQRLVHLPYLQNPGKVSGWESEKNVLLKLVIQW